jgi:hypothetical protein
VKAFEASHENINRRDAAELRRPAGRAAAEKNRGQTVNVAMSFRWGDEDSLRNREMAGALTMAMLAAAVAS